jgi:hypothetical protein
MADRSRRETSWENWGFCSTPFFCYGIDSRSPGVGSVDQRRRTTSREDWGRGDVHGSLGTIAEIRGICSRDQSSRMIFLASQTAEMTAWEESSRPCGDGSREHLGPCCEGGLDECWGWGSDEFHPRAKLTRILTTFPRGCKLCQGRYWTAFNQQSHPRFLRI